MVGPAVKREGVAHLRATMGLSERRACSIVSADRKMVRVTAHVGRQTRSSGRNCAISLNERKRFGISSACSSCCGRRASPRASTASTGFIAKKVLTVRKRRARRRAVGARAPILVEYKPNARGSVDLVHDQHCLHRPGGSAS